MADEATKHDRQSKDDEVTKEPETSEAAAAENAAAEPEGGAKQEAAPESEEDAGPASDPEPAADSASKPEPTRAAKAEPKPEPAREARLAQKHEPVRHGALPTAAWAVITCVALVVGVLAGHFLLGGVGQVSLSGRTTLSLGELGSTIATYSYNGQTTSVTADEVIEATGASALEDGSYAVPAARDVLAYVQNQILFSDAEARGITVSDDELTSMASSLYGTDDLSTLADAYGIDEDEVRESLRQGVLVNKLLDQFVTTELPTMPEAPEAPADGAEDTPTAEYASYVIGLLGDEWDSEADTWARTDGSYYAALSVYDISNEGATYQAASAAYGVAQSAYQTASDQRNEEWLAYTSSLLSNATIQLGSLAE